MRSPYTVLGVSKTAKAEDIKSAYRQLAKTWHPDQNPDDPQAGNRFAEISNAYKLLIDPNLRLEFDRGHIDARGRRRQRPARGFAANPFKAFKQAMGGATGTNAADDPGEGSDEASFEDMVVHIFGEAAASQSGRNATQDKPPGHRTKQDAPGMDEDPLDALDTLFTKWKTRHKAQSALPVTRHCVDISLEAAFEGHSGEIAFADDKTVAFTTPPGTVDGAEIQVPSPDPLTMGDAVVTIHHQKHPRFRSQGPDLHGEHAIDLAEAVLGGSFVFQGLDGPLRIEVPEWSGSDTVLRVQEKGLPTANGRRGALLVHLRVMLPQKPDPRLIDLMRSSRKALFV
ncbi:MAG: DnaJ C-terminal domain-containing protein [Hoeflea sp.]|uniref:DnaJ C-terminal domain-containing protein n=1 Tax=Hoeflea sp. TaxID=1940281 RepID=UPI003298EFE7